MTRLLLVAAVAIVVVLAAVGVGTGAGAELHVYPGAGTPIQTAIDGAGAGDTIYVHAGLYYENLDVGKRLTLIGDGADVVTVRAAEASDHVFEVTADWVNISGFTVTGTTGYRCAGIYLTGTDHCNISENNASGNGRYGIRLHDSSNNMLMNNDANSNGDSGYIGNFGYGYGICLYSSSNNNMLANNTASNNRLGIYLSSSSNNTLHGNSMSGNRYNFGVHGNSLSHYIHVIDTSNTVDGELIYYWVCQQDKMITGNAGFVGVVNSTNITIKDVTLTNNRHGVLFAYTENSRIENVTASNNRHGIYLLNSSNNTLNNNNANSNGDSGWLGNIGYGIYLLNSSNNTLVNNDANLNDVVGILLHEPSNYNMLVGNNASNNEFGIYLSSSSNNTLTNNTASNNRHGILLYESSNYNTLSSNTANLNDRGIILCSSSYYNACPSNNILQYFGIGTRQTFNGRDLRPGSESEYPAGSNQFFINDGIYADIFSQGNIVNVLHFGDHFRHPHFFRQLTGKNIGFRIAGHGNKDIHGFETFLQQQVYIPAITVDHEGIFEEIRQFGTFFAVYLNKFDIKLFLQVFSSTFSDTAASEDHNIVDIYFFLARKAGESFHPMAVCDHIDRVVQSETIGTTGDDGLIITGNGYRPVIGILSAPIQFKERISDDG